MSLEEVRRRRELRAQYEFDEDPPPRLLERDEDEREEPAGRRGLARRTPCARLHDLRELFLKRDARSNEVIVQILFVVVQERREHRLPVDSSRPDDIDA